MDRDDRETGGGLDRCQLVPPGSPRVPGRRTGPPPLPNSSVFVITLKLSPDCSGWELPRPIEEGDDEVIVVDEVELFDVEPDDIGSTGGARTDSLVPVACEDDDQEYADISRSASGGPNDRPWLYGIGVMAVAAAAVLALGAGQRGAPGVAWSGAGVSHAAMAKVARAPAEQPTIVLPGVVVVVSARDVGPGAKLALRQ